MTGTIRVAVEHGPRGRRVAVWALDWPGLQRGGSDEHTALANLSPFRDRYVVVAARAGLGEEFDPAGLFEVVERYDGSGMTDHYGISFRSLPREHDGLPTDEFERRLALLEACWAVFDEARGRVSAELEKGPRGGGRDRDQIVRHVVYNELDWAWKVGGPRVPKDPAEWVFDEGELADHRTNFLAGLRATHAAGGQARTWTLGFLVRHSAYHTMDHAWEMQDKDLSDH